MTPELQLRTLYVLDGSGRLVRPREPSPAPTPWFVLVRGADGCAYAVAADVADEIAAEALRLAADEPPVRDLEQPPVHANRYVELFGGRPGSGPAFTFPDALSVGDAVLIDDSAPLERHFPDWTGDFDPRSPVAAVLVDGHAVSVCCCARLSDEAAEAGLETAEAHRGRGYAAQATAAWALAIRASGRTPLYSTGWDNQASRAVARKLGLVAYASDWGVSR